MWLIAEGIRLTATAACIQAVSKISLDRERPAVQKCSPPAIRARGRFAQQREKSRALSDALKTERFYRAGTGTITESLRGRPHRRRPVVQDNTEQRTVNFKMTIVINEAHVPELVHEMADARSRRADHLGKCLLTDLGDDRFRFALFAEIRQQQQKPRQPFLG